MTEKSNKPNHEGRAPHKPGVEPEPSDYDSLQAAIRAMLWLIPPLIGGTSAPLFVWLTSQKIVNPPWGTGLWLILIVAVTAAAGWYYAKHPKSANSIADDFIDSIFLY